MTGRFTRPDEVADLVMMLASERCANMMGAGVTIDGGMVPTLRVSRLTAPTQH